MINGPVRTTVSVTMQELKRQPDLFPLTQRQFLPRLARRAEQEHHHAGIVIRFRHAHHALGLALAADEREHLERALARLRFRLAASVIKWRRSEHDSMLAHPLGHLRG